MVPAPIELRHSGVRGGLWGAVFWRVRVSGDICATTCRSKGGSEALWGRGHVKTRVLSPGPGGPAGHWVGARLTWGLQTPWESLSLTAEGGPGGV